MFREECITPRHNSKQKCSSSKRLPQGVWACCMQSNSGHPRPTQLNSVQSRSTQDNSGQPRSTQVNPSQPRPTKVNLGQARLTQANTSHTQTKIRPTQAIARSTQINSAQRRSTQAILRSHPGQLSSTQVNPGTPCQSRPTEAIPGHIQVNLGNTYPTPRSTQATSRPSQVNSC